MLFGITIKTNMHTNSVNISPISLVFKAVIYAGFFGWGGPQNVWGGAIFRGWNEILLLGKAQIFGVIFQKICIKINKNLQTDWENSRKMQIFQKIF